MDPVDYAEASGAARGLARYQPRHERGARGGTTCLRGRRISSRLARRLRQGQNLDRGWWRIQEAFHEYGFPESKTINTSVNEASLAKLVRTFESARSQAQPLLDRLISDSGVPGE
jgi:hypothetical protein